MSDNNYRSLIKESQLFENYYKEQKIVPEEEWETFLEYLKRDLPSTFRVVDASPYSSSIKYFLKNMEKVPLYEDDSSKEVEMLIKEINWYPNSLAYQITKSRDKLRRSSGELKDFHSKLVLMSDGGSILRQEAVSMLPVLFLNVNSEHYILDMCSAPGSKTSQIIEILQTNNKDDKTYAKGFVIANDLDTRRAHMLIHHTRHLNSPSLIVTTHSADHFPDLYIEKNKNDGITEKFLFDRILCDVPCSSDGTLRKNPNLFSKWSINFSLGLHRLQRNILLRALNLLKPKDGLLVYSTCSFNPLENEAVVSSVINSLLSKGINIEIVDPSEISDISKEVISKTKFGKGLNFWKVPIPKKKNKKNKRKKSEQVNNEELVDDEQFYKDYNDVPFHSREVIFPSMFPPDNIKIKESLSKCIRISPHQENTGGFFICIMRIVDIEKNEKKNSNISLSIQDDYLPFSNNPYKEDIIKMIFNPYGIHKYNKEQILNTLIYRNPKGDFNRACINKTKLENLDEINENIEKKEELTNDKSEILDEIRFPRKMWQVSTSVAEFLFSVKSKNPLRVIHAGFPGIELTRYRKGPIVIEENQIIDVNYPPIYRFNCAYNNYLYNQHNLPLNDTSRCKEFSINTVIKLLQSVEKPSESSGEFHPFRIPRYLLKEEEYPDLKNIFDFPGSIIIRLNLDKYNLKPIFLPAHVGRHHVELLLDKFLRYCIKFHIENILVNKI